MLAYPCEASPPQPPGILGQAVLPGTSEAPARIPVWRSRWVSGLLSRISAAGTKLPIRHVRCHGEYWGQSGPAADVTQSTQMTLSGRWMFGRIFGLDGRESYRELRLELLCCPHRLSRGTAPHEREYPRRKDRF